jgi:hypothetical protein
MPNLYPTYLRYIYDSLIKGSIHPENAAQFAKPFTIQVQKGYSLDWLIELDNEYEKSIKNL